MNRQGAKNAKTEPGGQLDQLAHDVIGAAIEVHRALGPGFLEGSYESAGLLINFNVPILKDGIHRIILSS